MKMHHQLTALFHRQPAERVLAVRRIFSRVNSHNFLRAVVALVLWAVVICVFSIVYEVWRLENNWRLGIAA